VPPQMDISRCTRLKGIHMPKFYYDGTSCYGNLTITE
jgi:hypothetical protein